VDRDTLLAFVRFHAWANDRILATAAGLSDAEFRRAANLDHGSAFTTLRHLVDVNWSWRELCIGNDVAETYVWDPADRRRSSAGDGGRGSPPRTTTLDVYPDPDDMTRVHG
jgi:uncharacterized damage-inducible protein DinB